MSKGISQQTTEPILGLPAGREIRGGLDGVGHRFGIAVSRYNDILTSQQVRDAIDVLKEAGVAEDAIDVVWVPGAYELPSVVERLARCESYSALMAFGVVIQGETPHADLIGQEVAHHLTAIAREHGLPVLDGVVVAGTYELAEARSASGPQSRAPYVAEAALEMASVFQQLERK